MQEITVTPLEALYRLISAASMIDSAECKDEAIYNTLQGELVVAKEVAKALAMAPKQEAPWDSFDIQRTGNEHIDASGFLLTAAMEWWYASRKAKVNGAVKWLEGEDGSLLIFTRGEYRDKLMANIDAYGCEPVKFFNDKQPVAAPAVANGALTDAQINEVWESLPGLKIVAGRPIDHWNSLLRHEFARAILAAAGPDAALVKALEGALAVIDDYLSYTHDGDPWKEDARAMGEMDINDADNDGRIESWRAALSGAKGN